MRMPLASSRSANATCAPHWSESSRRRAKWKSLPQRLWPLSTPTRKINAQGQWIDRSEHIDLNALFERMSRDELEAYARSGKLPEWFTETVGTVATAADDREDD